MSIGVGLVALFSLVQINKSGSRHLRGRAGKVKWLTVTRAPHVMHSNGGGTSEQVRGPLATARGLVGLAEGEDSGTRGLPLVAAGTHAFNVEGIAWTAAPDVPNRVPVSPCRSLSGPGPRHHTTPTLVERTSSCLWAPAQHLELSAACSVHVG